MRLIIYWLNAVIWGTTRFFSVSSYGLQICVCFYYDRKCQCITLQELGKNIPFEKLHCVRCVNGKSYAVIMLFNERIVLFKKIKTKFLAASIF